MFREAARTVLPARRTTRTQPGVLLRRVAAGWIDPTIAVTLAVPVSLLAGRTPATGVWMGLAFAWYAVPEIAYATTFGKHLVGLRVVTRATGGRPEPWRVLVRTAARPIDLLPALYLLGLVLVLVTGRRRARLGDLLAGTSVC